MNFLTANFSFLVFSDKAPTNNPLLKSVDWSRRIFDFLVKKPEFKTTVLPPNTTLSVFNTVRSHLMTPASSLNLSLLSPTESRYRLSVSGPANFKTARAVTGITSCVVSVNNNAMVNFDFAGANLSSVVSGDIMRIRSFSTYDSGPYAFNPNNGGLWKVLLVSGTTVQAVRLDTSVPISSVNETVAAAASDVQFYANDNIQTGDTINISGTFASVSHGSYKILDVTPNSVDFLSVRPLPLETTNYVNDTIYFYGDSKTFLYVESDRELIVQLNSDNTFNNVIKPLMVNAPDEYPAIFFTTGYLYNIVFVNNSVHTVTVKYFTAE